MSVMGKYKSGKVYSSQVHIFHKAAILHTFIDLCVS